jgi:hypothetical protein
MSAARWPAALLYAVASVVSFADAAPIPKEFKPGTGDYFPTAVGTRWEYVADGTDKLDHTREVTEATVGDGTTTAVFTWTSHGGQYTSASVYRVDAKQVARTGWSKEQPFDTPALMWKAEAKAGDTWTVGIVGPAEATQFTATRGKETEVTTPAGKFKAVPVTIRPGKNEKEANTYWYAPGVGLVRWDNQNGKTIVLSKFTPGKEAKK